MKTGIQAMNGSAWYNRASEEYCVGYAPNDFGNVYLRVDVDPLLELLDDLLAMGFDGHCNGTCIPLTEELYKKLEELKKS